MRCSRASGEPETAVFSASSRKGEIADCSARRGRQAGQAGYQYMYLDRHVSQLASSEEGKGKRFWAGWGRPRGNAATCRTKSPGGKRTAGGVRTNSLMV